MSMSDVTIPEVFDIGEILKRLPHRYPFVMVDRVLELVPDKRITGFKNVTFNEPFFQGHFPEKPVMPGVLILEGMAQIGCIMAYCSAGDSAKGKLIYFAGIDKARFKKVVVPGDQIVFKLTKLKEKRGIIVMDGKAYVDDQLVASAELMATFN